MGFYEDQYTELKESAKSNTLVNDIVAFLKTDGGIIYLGIDDSGAPVGLSGFDEDSKIVSEIIANQIEPCPRNLIDVDTITIDEKKIIKISIRSGNELYYVRKHGLCVSGCYERIGPDKGGHWKIKDKKKRN